MISGRDLVIVLMVTLGMCGCGSSTKTGTTPVPEDPAAAPQPGSLDAAFTRIAVRVPEFASLYFDDQRTLHVLLIGDASRTAQLSTVIEAIVRAGLIDRRQAEQTRIVLEPAKTRYSWFDLDTFKAAMRDVLTLPDVTSLDADEGAGLITIGIADRKFKLALQHRPVRVNGLLVNPNPPSSDPAR